jgi:hypothetical protein
MPNEPASIKIGSLLINIMRYQYSNADEYWDANWLFVNAKYNRGNSAVLASGPIIHVSEIQSFKQQCELMSSSLQGKAHFSCMEPNIDIKFEMDKRGSVDVVIQITPDNMIEEHTFFEEIDQTFLNQIIIDLENALECFPIKFDSDKK